MKERALPVLVVEKGMVVLCVRVLREEVAEVVTGGLVRLCV